MPVKKAINYVIYILFFLDLFFISAILSFQVTVQGEMVTLPNLIGKTIEEAKIELQDKKIHLIQSGVRLHERLEQGKIFFQDPPAESKVKLNTEVMVLLSAGREKVKVPELLGKNLQTIRPILEESGFRVGKISHVHTPKYAAGRIIGQYPPAQAEVGRGTPVSLLVSQGEYEVGFLMPDLIGKRAGRVIAQLEDLEFNLGNIRYRYYRGLDSGVIINQYPPPGSKIQKRNRITFEVSR